MDKLALLYFASEVLLDPGRLTLELRYHPAGMMRKTRIGCIARVDSPKQVIANLGSAFIGQSSASTSGARWHRIELPELRRRWPCPVDGPAYPRLATIATYVPTVTIGRLSLASLLWYTLAAGCSGSVASREVV